MALCWEGSVSFHSRSTSLHRPRRVGLSSRETQERREIDRTAAVRLPFGPFTGFDLFISFKCAFLIYFPFVGSTARWED